MTPNEFCKRWVMHYVRPEYFWLPWTDPTIKLYYGYFYTNNHTYKVKDFFPEDPDITDKDGLIMVKVLILDQLQKQKEYLDLLREYNRLRGMYNTLLAIKQSIINDIKTAIETTLRSELETEMQDVLQTISDWLDELCEWMHGQGDKPLRPQIHIDASESQAVDNALSSLSDMLDDAKSDLEARFPIDPDPSYPWDDDPDYDEDTVVYAKTAGAAGLKKVPLKIVSSGTYLPADYDADMFTKAEVKVTLTELNKAINEMRNKINALRQQLDALWDSIYNEVVKYINDIVDEYNKKIDTEYFVQMVTDAAEKCLGHPIEEEDYEMIEDAINPEDIIDDPEIWCIAPDGTFHRVSWAMVNKPYSGGTKEFVFTNSGEQFPYYQTYVWLVFYGLQDGIVPTRHQEAGHDGGYDGGWYDFVIHYSGSVWQWDGYTLETPPRETAMELRTIKSATYQIDHVGHSVMFRFICDVYSRYNEYGWVGARPLLDEVLERQYSFSIPYFTSGN